MPSSSARVSSTRQSGVALGGSAPGEAALTALPVQVGPGLLRRRRDREDHVGAFGHGAVPQLQAHHETRGVQGGQHRLGVGEVVGIDAADQQCAQAAIGSRGQNAIDVTAIGGRQVCDIPALGHLRAGGLVAERPATGQQSGQRAGLDRASLAGAARHPGQLRAGAFGESGRGRQGTGRGGETFADQDDRTGFGEETSELAAGQRVQRGGLTAGRGLDQRAVHFLQTVAGERRNRVDRQTVLARGLAQPQVHDRRLFLWFEAGQQYHRR